MLYFLYKIGAFISLHISLKNAYKLAAFLSRIYAFLSPKDRQALRDNFKTLFPKADEKEIKILTKKVFVNFCKYLVDFFRLPLIDEDFIKNRVKLDGIEYLNKALLKGKGVVLVSAHIGNWELGGAVLSKIGYKMNAVALSHKHKKIDDFFNTRRKLFGVRPIAFGSALRQCFRCLSQNEILALVGDRDYFSNGIQMPFFKKKTIIPKGPAVLSLRFFSPIVPCFILRNPDDTFTFKFYPPIEQNPTNDKDKDIKSMTLKHVKISEEVIKSHPEQWYAFRRFWERLEWGL